jgi:hypothetical protein
MPAKGAEWTVMVYMAGNNSLSDAAGADLVEMQKVGSTDDVQVRVFVKQADGGGARRLLVTKGGEDDVEELGDVDSGDPQAVVDFARWAAARSPAERYALVLWNHGGGWRPSQMDAVASEVRGEEPRGRRQGEANRRATQPLAWSLFTTTVRKVAELPTRGEREICSDDGSGHSLDTIELGRVLRALRRDLDQPIDLLGMDACLMSNLEVAYEVREEAKAIVASEELEPGAGWPYHDILARLTSKPAADPDALGDTIVDRYIESYRDQESVWPVTQCSVTTARIDELAGPLDVLSAALREHMSDVWPALMTAHANAVRFEAELVDLGTLCAGLTGASLPAEVREAAEAVQQALRPREGYVVSEGHLGDKVEGCLGVSVYMPGPTEPVSRFYEQLAFAKAHRWDELLAAYRRAVRAGR